MVADTAPIARSAPHEIPIETLRSSAVILLVSYHVIGADAHSGLSIDYPHMLRLFADFFVDVRMPLFAFIAGFIYALRRVTLQTYSKFVAGKLRRLYVPSLVAAFAFAMASLILGSRFAVPLADVWYILVFPFAHFWFLQAILVIFIVYGIVDALVGQRFAVGFLLLSSAIYLGDYTLSLNFFSVNNAVYLWPFFMLGVVFNRHAADIWADAERLTLVIVGIAVFCALWNIKILYETGSFSLVRRDAQSLGFGMAIPALLFMWAPRLSLLERLSPYAFTIYLYHVFGTVAVRTMLDQVGIVGHEIRFMLGLVGGLAVPIVLHEVASRRIWVGAFLLGRPARPSAPQLGASAHT